MSGGRWNEPANTFAPQGATRGVNKWAASRRLIKGSGILRPPPGVRARPRTGTLWQPQAASKRDFNRRLSLGTSRAGAKSLDMQGEGVEGDHTGSPSGLAEIESS